MKCLCYFLFLMVGWLFVILLLGMVVVVIGVIMLVIFKCQQEFEWQNLNCIVDCLQGYVNLLDGNLELCECLLVIGGLSVCVLQLGVCLGWVDMVLMEVLEDCFGLVLCVYVYFVLFCFCIFKLQELLLLLLLGYWWLLCECDFVFILFKCCVVDVIFNDGMLLKLVLDLLVVVYNGIFVVDLWFLILLVLVIVVLVYIVLCMVSVLLQELVVVVEDFGDDLQCDLLLLCGLCEVQCVVEVFNVMQYCLQWYLVECMQMLVVIIYDLQMLLIWLCLCLENVSDEVLCECLIGDLVVMQVLVCEGLELVCSVESVEQCVVLDLDLLLESIVEDVVEGGGDVVFEGGSGLVLMLCLLVMYCLFFNLVDNVVMYVQWVWVWVECSGGVIIVVVVDDGLGLVEEQLEVVFDLFVWVEILCLCQIGGVGLGLIIVCVLVEKDGVWLWLCNWVEGGLEVVVQWLVSVQVVVFGCVG